jgi:hypothetical protein
MIECLYTIVMLYHVCYMNKLFLPTAYRLTQGLIGKLDDTWVISTMTLSVILCEGPFCKSPAGGSSLLGTTTFLTSGTNRAV